jgi:hypothetical protein
MIQLGGNVVRNMNVTNPLMILIVSILLFLLKCYLVQLSYNEIFPLLRYNLLSGIETNVNQREPPQFVPISFGQSIIMVILFNNLFVM